MTPPAPTTLVWAGLLCTPVMISAGQILFKLAGNRIDGREVTGLAGLIQTLFDPFLLTAFAIYGSATVLWVYVLRYLTLSQAYPFMALSFVLVPLASHVFFGETLGLRYWLGAALLISGMMVMNT